VTLVLDCSVTLAWSSPGELTSPVQLVLDKVGMAGAWVPALWRLEVANGLQMGVRKGRIRPDHRDRELENLAKLDIQIDPHTDEYAWSSILHVSDRRRLTVYDAAYLELAIRRKLPLATLDKELRAAAEAEGVGLLGL
jgi:predicted nucleic acid-binding protein